MPKPRRHVLLLSLLLLIIIISPIDAHEGGLLLQRSDPPINAVLPVSPAVVRLWFEDPLVKEISRFQIRDINARVIETAPSQFDPDDPTQMFIALDEPLPEGLYTVTWWAFSDTDGHDSVGSFPFVIGQVRSEYNEALDLRESIPFDGTVSRWFNLIGLSLLAGGLSFWLFVWTPTVSGGQALVEAWMRRLIWIGWLIFGIVNAYFLFAYILRLMAVNGENDLLLAISLVIGTRFGLLWLLQCLLWIGCGIALYLLPNRRTMMLWLALILVAILILAQSAVSRIAGVQDPMAAIAGNWLHLLVSVIWCGGLAYLILTTRTLHGHSGAKPELFGALLARFANFTRLGFVALSLTGVYIAWLRVGSVDTLNNTLYGQILLIKLVFILPLLLLMVFNGLITQRRLQTGKSVWVRWLPLAVGAEIAVLIAVFVTVGMLTAISPARDVMALRAAIPQTLDAPPTIQEIDTVDGLHVQLFLQPAMVGENRVAFTVFNGQTGDRITDVSAIEMQFNDEAVESRILRHEDGNYILEDVIIDDSGTLNVTVSVRREGAEPILLNFQPQIAQPISSTVPTIDTTIPVDERVLTASFAGILLAASGILFMGQRRILTAVSIGALTAAGLILNSGILLIAAGLTGIAFGGSVAGSRRFANAMTLMAISLLVVGGAFLIAAGLAWQSVIA